MREFGPVRMNYPSQCPSTSLLLRSRLLLDSVAGGRLQERVIYPDTVLTRADSSHTANQEWMAFPMSVCTARASAATR